MSRVESKRGDSAAGAIHRSCGILLAASAVCVLSSASSQSTQGQYAHIEQQILDQTKNNVALADELDNTAHDIEAQRVHSLSDVSSLYQRWLLITQRLDTLRRLVTPGSTPAPDTPPMIIPTDLMQYLRLCEYRDKLTQDYKVALTLEAQLVDNRNRQLFLQKLLDPLSATWTQLLSAELTVQSLEDQVKRLESLLQQQNQYNWDLGTEVALYLLGFKWLWGAFTGYAPTTYAASADRADITLAIQHIQQRRTIELKRAATLATTFTDQLQILATHLSETDKNDASVTEQLLYQYGLEIIRDTYDTLRASLLQRDIYSRIANDYALQGTQYARDVAGTTEPLTNVSVATELLTSDERESNHSAEDFESADVAAALKRISSIILVTPTKEYPQKATSAAINAKIAQVADLIRLTPTSIVTQAAEFSDSNSRVVAARTRQAREDTQARLATLQAHLDGLLPVYTNLYKVTVATRSIRRRFEELLLSQAQLASHSRYIRLLEQRLASEQSANRSYIREAFLYLFGFKWLWGAFNGYNDTYNDPTLVEELRRRQSEQRLAQAGLLPKITELRSQIDQFRADIESLLQETRSATTDINIWNITNQYTLHYEQVLLEYGLAVNNYELALQNNNRLQYDALNPYYSDHNQEYTTSLGVSHLDPHAQFLATELSAARSRLDLAMKRFDELFSFPELEDIFSDYIHTEIELAVTKTRLEALQAGQDEPMNSTLEGQDV